jgi:eukaryotic-like serine/threonine-protein kinase
LNFRIACALSVDQIAPHCRHLPPARTARIFADGRSASCKRSTRTCHVHENICPDCRRISSTFAKDSARRYANGAALLGALQALQRPVSAPRLNRTLAAACAILVAASGWFGWRTWQTRQAREVWIPESLRLFEVCESFASLKLASKAAKWLPDDLRLIARHAPLVVETEPEGADVYLGEYLKPDTWEKVGTTPLRIVPGLIHPFSLVRYKVAKAGYDDAIGTIATADRLQLKLMKTGEAPSGMVAVAGGTENGQMVPAFWMDRYEVANAEYKRFVDAGGYRDSKHWQEFFVAGNGTISFEEAMKRFTDATGRPGRRRGAWVPTRTARTGSP